MEFTLIFGATLIYVNYVRLGLSHDLRADRLDRSLMSLDQLTLINRCLAVVLIALYLALGYFVVFDLL